MSEQQAAPTTDELLAHAGWLKRLAERLVGTGDRADNLVQETWLAALRHGPRRDKSLRPWLATVLRNFAVSSARTGARRSWREEQHARPEALPSTEELTARAEASRTLVEAVLALPEKQRVVVLLRYFEQLPTPEIAARLGCPPSTVRSHLSRAVERLRTQLDRIAGGDRSSWVRCLAPLPVAISTAPSILGALAMSNAAKLAAIIISTSLIGVGLWSALDETEATTPGLGDALDPDQVVLVDPEPNLDNLETPDKALATADQPTRTVAGGGPVRGVLVDPRSGEPLPWFPLGIASGPAPEGSGGLTNPPQTRERVVTDEQGRFQSAESYDWGDVYLIPLEDWDRTEFLWTMMKPPRARPALTISHDPDLSEPTTVELESGPAYRLICPQAEGIGFSGFAAVLTHSEHLLTGRSSATHVAQEPVALARFLPFGRDERRAKFDTLHLLSRDGLWAGWARVEVRSGLAPRPVTIDLAPCVTLRVEVSADSFPPLEEVLLAIWEGALDDVALDQREPLSEPTTSNSVGARTSQSTPRPVVFRRKFLPPGSYTLRARSVGFADQVEQVELRQGEQHIEIVLTRTKAANGRIEGIVVPRSGQRPAVECIARSRRKGGSASSSGRIAELKWTERNGNWSATFAFDNLLDAEYHVWIACDMRVFGDVAGPTFEPSNSLVRPDGPRLEFELIDPPPARLLMVQARDSPTGKPLAVFRVTAILPVTGSEPRTVEGADGNALIQLGGELEGGRLWVSAPGYAPLFVEVPASTGPDGVLHTTVHLDPGWGAPIGVFVLDGEQRRPAAGVEVLADDRVIATTDETGVAWLSLAARPERLSVSAPGLVLQETGGPIDGEGRLEEGTLEPMRESFYFILRRDP